MTLNSIGVLFNPLSFIPSSLPILYTPPSLALFSLPMLFTALFPLFSHHPSPLFDSPSFSPPLTSVLQKSVVEQLRKDLLVKQEPEVTVQVPAPDKHILQIPSSATLLALQQTTHTQALQQVATQVHRHCRPLLNCLLCCTKARCNFAVAYTRFAKFPRFS